jgi:tripartite-type tricarboxylate transporter receptor subunit TctC
MTRVLRALAVAVLALAEAGAAPAPAPVPYPHRVVTLVTHSTPGGGSDVFLREMVRHLRKYVNATFIIENVSGGSGARAISRVAAAKPDGSIFYATTPTYVLTSLLSRPPHSYRDLEPVVNFFTDTEIVYTRADGPFRSLKDVIDRARTARGRWGAANPASLERHAAEQLKRLSKVNAAIVSHEGGGDLMINVLNGTLDIGVGEIGETRSQLDAGKIRILAVFNATRVPAYPNVPTVKELGYDVVVEKFRGLAGPKGLPPNIIRIWEDAAQKLLADPEYQRAYAEEILVSNYIPHARYGAFVTRFADDTGRALREIGAIR